jgi:hypothetical protein
MALVPTFDAERFSRPASKPMQSNVPPHNYPWERDARALAYLEARVAVERAEHFATKTPGTPTGPRHPAYLHRVQLRAFVAGVASTLLVCMIVYVLSRLAG